jgi:hypothetical protein
MGNCARCNKDLKPWMLTEPSAYGEATVCDVCAVQEMIETRGYGPKGELQFKCKKYEGTPYWKEVENVLV